MPADLHEVAFFDPAMLELVAAAGRGDDLCRGGSRISSAPLTVVVVDVGLQDRADRDATAARRIHEPRHASRCGSTITASERGPPGGSSRPIRACGRSRCPPPGCGRSALIAMRCTFRSCCCSSLLWPDASVTPDQWRCHGGLPRLGSVGGKSGDKLDKWHASPGGVNRAEVGGALGRATGSKAQLLPARSSLQSQRVGRVIVVGSINVDFTVHAKRLPRAGETVTGGTFQRSGGGKGASQAVAAARAGAAVTFIGAVGQDDLGDAAWPSWLPKAWTPVAATGSADAATGGADRGGPERRQPDRGRVRSQPGVSRLGRGEGSHGAWRHDRGRADHEPGTGG